MKLITTSAVALGAAFAAAPVYAQYAAPMQSPQGAAPSQSAAPSAGASGPQVKPSAKAIKAIMDLQDAVNRKDWANVPAKVAAAQAVASTKEDRYLIGSLQLRAAALNNDSAAFGSALETVAQTGVVKPATLAPLYVNLAGTYFNNKQYAQAVGAYQKSAALDPLNLDTVKLLGEAQSAAGQKADAAATFERVIQARSAAGQKPDEDVLKRAVANAYEAKSPAAIDLTRKWVAAYPSVTSWSDALAVYGNLNQTDAEGKLALFRLMQVTGALNSGTKYAQYAIAATDLNDTTEAQAAIDAAIAAKQINPSDPEYREIVESVRAKPKATAADLAAATKEAVNGTALLRIGDRYYAMGEYGKALELYRMAAGKPGVDSSTTNLHIGMALARTGDKAGAAAALNSVTGAHAEIAKYWLLFLNQRA